jgi:hypothetical protein
MLTSDPRLNRTHSTKLSAGRVLRLATLPVYVGTVPSADLGLTPSGRLARSPVIFIRHCASNAVLKLYLSK